MPLTLLAIFLAFAAPAPLAETTFALEDEAMVELCRSVRRRAPVPARRADGAPPRSPLPKETFEFRSPAPVGWTPRLLSRPPPL